MHEALGGHVDISHNKSMKNEEKEKVIILTLPIFWGQDSPMCVKISRLMFEEKQAICRICKYLSKIHTILKSKMISS